MRSAQRRSHPTQRPTRPSWHYLPSSLRRSGVQFGDCSLLAVAVPHCPAEHKRRAWGIAVQARSGAMPASNGTGVPKVTHLHDVGSSETESASWRSPSHRDASSQPGKRACQRQCGLEVFPQIRKQRHRSDSPAFVMLYLGLGCVHHTRLVPPNRPTPQPHIQIRVEVQSGIGVLI